MCVCVCQGGVGVEGWHLAILSGQPPLLKSFSTLIYCNCTTYLFFNRVFALGSPQSFSIFVIAARKMQPAAQKSSEIDRCGRKGDRFPHLGCVSRCVWSVGRR